MLSDPSPGWPASTSSWGTIETTCLFGCRVIARKKGIRLMIYKRVIVTLWGKRKESFLFQKEKLGTENTNCTAAMVKQVCRKIFSGKIIILKDSHHHDSNLKDSIISDSWHSPESICSAAMQLHSSWFVLSGSRELRCAWNSNFGWAWCLCTSTCYQF